MDLLWLYFLVHATFACFACTLAENMTKTHKTPRLVLYYQTTHDRNGNSVSLLPLLQNHVPVTHLIVGAFHVSARSDVYLNDDLPSSFKFSALWRETKQLQEVGIKIMGMIGGAAPGSFSVSTLDGDEATFRKHYYKLQSLVQTYGLEGLDLDVEEPMSQGGITRLIKQLHADFGSDFLVTLAPVASALWNDHNISGFSYSEVEKSIGSNIAFYNAQFYNGFGGLSDGRDYDNVVNNGWAPEKIVAGLLTSPANGVGYVATDVISKAIASIRNQHGQFGGVSGWEYFNAEPGGRQQPWKWLQIIGNTLKPAGI